MTRRLHNWSYRDVTQFLKEHSFVHHRPYFGSHEIWAKLKDNGTPEREVEVSKRKDAYPPKTMKNMIHQSGIDEAEWIRWAGS